MWLKNNFVYLIFVATVGGISSYYFISQFVWFFLLLVFIAIALQADTFLRTEKPNRKNNKVEKFVLLFFLILIFTGAHLRTNYKNAVPILANFYDEQISVEGSIIGNPKTSPRSKRYTLHINNISTGGTHEKRNTLHFRKKEKLIFYTSQDVYYKHGDVVRTTGELKKPENFTNDSGQEFDYFNFLAKDAIHGQIFFSESSLEYSNLNNYSRMLFDFKNNLKSKINSVIPEPQNGLLLGLFLGDKEHLDSELENNFRKVGLTHVIVFSGFHVSLLIFLVYKLLFFVPRFLKYLISIIFCVSLAIMVGSGSAVIRASLMMFFVIFGKMVGRNYKINRSLALSATIMLLYNPLMLFHDISFRLSFLATWGIVNLSKKVEEKINFMPAKFKIRQIASVTLSAQLSTLPIILNMNGELSIISTLVNLIIVPFVPILILGAIVNVFFLFVIKPAALLISYFLNQLLHAVIFLVEVFAKMPFSTVKVSTLGLWQIILFYSFLIIFLYYRPVEVFKKVVNILRFATRLIIRNK